MDVDLEHLRRHVAENGVSGEEVAEGVRNNTVRPGRAVGGRLGVCALTPPLPTPRSRGTWS